MNFNTQSMLVRRQTRTDIPTCTNVKNKNKNALKTCTDINVNKCFLKPIRLRELWWTHEWNEHAIYYYLFWEKLEGSQLVPPSITHISCNATGMAEGCFEWKIASNSFGQDIVTLFTGSVMISHTTAVKPVTSEQTQALDGWTPALTSWAERYMMGGLAFFF